MKINISLAKARPKLGSLIEESRSSGRETIIAKRGFPAAALTDYDTYLNRKETAVVLADRALMMGMRRGLRELKTGKAHLYTLDELFLDK